MTRLHLPLALLAPFLAACTIGSVSLTGDTDATGGATDGPSSDGSGGTSTTATGGTTTLDPTTDSPTTAMTTGVAWAPALDILFIIDNSGSMTEEQVRLNNSIGALLAPLADYDLRIAITTTDVGNPRCPAADTTPEAGRFVLSSCRERVPDGEFVLEQQGLDFSWACTDFCDLDTLHVLPTATHDDPDPKPRAWLERTAGVANVDVPLADALACALPQGVSGCGFESPLESMALALSRALDPADPTNAGFLRPGADLAIVFLTDEMDCSHNPAFDVIFTTDKTFWEDPQGPASTSAVCFNAGVECVGGPGTYDSCSATDHDITGAVTMDPSKAVLRPVSHYINFLQQIEGDRDVHIIAIAGVPPGFETGGVPLVYADSPDLNYQHDFGIGPGCTGDEPMSPTTAIPPSRLLELADAFNQSRFFSICDKNGYDAAMLAVGAL